MFLKEQFCPQLLFKFFDLNDLKYFKIIYHLMLHLMFNAKLFFFSYNYFETEVKPKTR